MNKRITNKEIETFPTFENIEEASQFLIEKYGEDFVFSEKKVIEKKTVHAYLYILDRETFERMQSYIQRKGSRLLPITDPETKGFTDSCQKVNIWEDGRIQLIGG